MTKQIRVAAVLAIFFLLACNKNKHKQYSTWYVNGEAYSTNDVKLVSSKGGQADLRGKVSPTQEEFSIGFSTRYLYDKHGSFLLTNDSTNYNPFDAGMSIWHNGTYYILANNLKDTVTASRFNDKLQLGMTDVWFKNYYNQDDSILVSGTFREP